MVRSQRNANVKIEHTRLSLGLVKVALFTDCDECDVNSDAPSGLEDV